jgi:methylated-DNA-[protein]-cysteine S-methyltransferase
MTIRWTTLDSPLGNLLLVGEDGPDTPFALTHVTLPQQTGRAVARVGPDWVPVTAPDGGPFAAALTQLRAYFAGELTAFELPLRAGGTEFRERVWAALEEIPPGTTTTYSGLAAELDRTGAARAVGGAVGANPLLIIRPCHRVIGADGSLTGFAGGTEAKRWLLRHEGCGSPRDCTGAPGG